MNYVADFETITDANDCRVWAYAVYNVEKDKIEKIGNHIDKFMDWLLKLEDGKVWFHNLKFDGEFIISWLFKNKFKYREERKKIKENEFTTLISDMGQFYSMTIQRSEYKIIIQDSLKILPMSVSAIAKSFGLEESKLEIDYNEFREEGHILTEQEEEYIKNDVIIVGKALAIQFRHGLTRMTTGSNALHDYKKRIGGFKRFLKYFPSIEYEVDKDIRQAYRGGFTYVSPRHQNKTIGNGITLDVNSLYPDRMMNCLLPYGVPIRFEGEYRNDRAYPLYIQCVKCDIKLKPKHIPSIALKHMRFASNEYITDTEGEEIVLYLTSTDLGLMFQQYDVESIEYLGGYKFKGAKGLFRTYIEYWIGQKNQATIEGNKGLRQLAKLMLNSLYGKFGLNPDTKSKHPYIEKGVVKYYVGKAERRKSIYIPMAVYITSEARYKTITAAQKLYDRFMYADTDSLHLEGTELPEILDVDNVKLGAWAHEATFTQAKFIRQKTYVEVVDGELHITCAGMPKTCYDQVTFDNFTEGSTYGGKLLPKHVVGGIVLVEKEFTIR